MQWFPDSTCSLFISFPPHHYELFHLFKMKPKQTVANFSFTRTVEEKISQLSCFEVYHRHISALCGKQKKLALDMRLSYTKSENEMDHL